MKIKFNYIKFKNILSYGNAFTTFEFKNGLNLIKATNGCGKSSILEALTYCLYGKPYRDIKLENLINRENKKDLLTELIFSISDKTYRLTRGMIPNIFTLEIKKNDKFVLTESLSSKKLNQEVINKLIGIDYVLYKNIVGLNNNEPFLSCNTAKRRIIIDNIFDLEILSNMLKNIKKRLSINKVEQNLKLNDLTSFSRQLADNIQFQNDINLKILNFNTEKEKNLKKLNESLKSYTKEVNDTTKKINNLQNNYNQLQIDINIENTLNELKEQKQLLISKKAEIMAKAKLMNKQKNDLCNNTICPFCGTNLKSSEHIQTHINQIKTELIESKKQFSIIDSEYIDICKKIDNIESTLNQKEKILQEIKNQENINKIQISNVNTILDNIKNTENRQLDFDIDKIKIKIDELEKNKNNVEKEYNTITENVSNDNTLVKILSDDGIKSYFLQTILPILNNRINIYLKKFNFEFSINFNSELEPTISNNRNLADYSQFSGGEKKRIDVSILLSFIDIAKSISNWSCNVLFLDEIFDNGIDDDGLDTIIQSLKDVIINNENNDKDISINLISHKKLNENMIWDHKYFISKLIFSKIEEQG